MKHPRLFRTIAPRSVYDVMAAIACFGVLAGGTAYAANTIGGGDIIDNSVSSADIRDDTLGFGGLAAQDLGPGSVGSSEVADDSLTNADIKNFSLGNGDFLTGSVDSRAVTDNSLTGFDIKDGLIGQVDIADTAINSAKVANDSLTGTDINESTLDLSTATAATFAYPANPVNLNQDETFTKITSKNLPAGAWAITGTAHTSTYGYGDGIRTAWCELRNGTSFIGGTDDRRVIPAQQELTRSLAMSGGAQIPAGGGEVSLWCRAQSGNFSGETVEGAQMMMIRVGGFG